ncbi:LOW QUALITY PROTEIN: probable pectinesterase/pectinesterase inhibitor 36 [Prosopis cineraria]|uniref:LOW QUALITY PROTEIN: probable pectinesterase/pectinesterase inhibitor 36 n=1 Tax=Prosopis cineraria TaxID=364024 RepID=UPI0024107A4F|nr:LOW QUALITY PROTEIN: probable pectinesterase/pectinesterase inhibitor 36 [Prosopis cineraria]
MAVSNVASVLLLLLLSATTMSTVFCRREMELLQMAQTQVLEAKTWVEISRRQSGAASNSMLSSTSAVAPAELGVALRDCAKLYEESEHRLNQLVLWKEDQYQKPGFDREDVVTWVSSVMSNHRTCLEGLEEKGYVEAGHQGLHKNLTTLLGEALHLFVKNKPKAKISSLKIFFELADVSGDGFWGRDMTIENRAGPQDHQAVAMKVSSDLSVFYRCSFRGYQDTLYVHSNRQFYRDSIISGTVDFIFGDASVVFQSCDIVLRQPMSHQPNFITAQGRDDPNEPTGIVIQNCRVRAAASGSGGAAAATKNYLGRPWKKYSRTVFMKNDLDGCIDPKGWSGEWSGGFALSTLYYAEYMNNGAGASTQNRVKWPGFHVIRAPSEVRPFSVDEFLLGSRWIPATGVPFSAGVFKIYM